MRSPIDRLIPEAGNYFLSQNAISRLHRQVSLFTWLQALVYQLP
ncbi:hypothetical protein MC7420_5356 [Coleofasciculus chthonoplastes PCC 7420]|uniref:Uncharacterized protein n=1 Tax=Coleofasciculus chthonoplastes PCC 7420 TaxID=118168 RepID=B4VQ94_9CYAN|nr:hypothetical protein MC7420_5356 [Coleofasciculus chthonoplastes PCC 7420]